MKYIESKTRLFKLSPLSAAFATVLSFSQINLAVAEAVPEGFFLLPDGKMLAENPKTAVAPDGYHLRPNGILIKIDADEDILALKPAGQMNADKIPPGFHKMGDGTLMANNPSTAKVPAGYHMMPDGTLMSSGGGESHHGKGMLMADYKFTYMSMKDMLDTNTELTADSATDPLGTYQYTMAPTSMGMSMHMGMLMYGFSNDVMGMVMMHYMSNTMNMKTRAGAVSTMKSSGLGDTPVTLMLKGPHHLNFTVGISLPTGSINVRGPMLHNTATTPQQGFKYPYGMQLGSGSYELIQGIDYSDSAGKISWGTNYQLNARLNQNKYKYKLGNKFKMESWTQWDMIPLLSVKANVAIHNNGQISGFDPEIDSFKTMSPTLDASNYGGSRVDVGGGAIINIPGDTYKVTADFSLPVYQNLWGPQMATSWVASINVGGMW